MNKSNLTQMLQVVRACLRENDRLIRQNHECIKLVHDALNYKGAPPHSSVTITNTNNGGGKLS